MTPRSRLAGVALGLGLLPVVVLGCGSSDDDPGDPAPTHATPGGTGENEPDENEPDEKENAPGDGENEPDENEPGDGENEPDENENGDS